MAYGYESASGRRLFLNRDPIAEASGLNLYGFCGNDGVNRYDYLGMEGFWSSFANAISNFFGSGDKLPVVNPDDPVQLPKITVTGDEDESGGSKPGSNDPAPFDAIGDYQRRSAIDDVNDSRRGDPSAVRLGVEWLTGIGPRDRTFGEGDRVTSDMQRTKELRNARDILKEQIAKGDRSTYSFGRRLKDESRLSFVIGFGVNMMTNRTRAYLGSFSGEARVLKVEGGVAVVVFTIKNSSGLESATRLPPPYGYSDRSDGSPRPSLVEMPGGLNHINERSDLMPKSILPDNYFNILGLKPGSNTSQTITWVESIPLDTK